MSYVVLWRPSALREADRVRAAHPDPVAAGRALDHIDYTLRRTPNDMGESRDPGIRLWYGDIVGVLYRVDDDRGRVDVVAAAPARRR